MQNFGNGRQLRDYEIAEARRRMGALNTTGQSMGYTGNIPSLSSSTTTGYAEVQQARQNMNQGTFTSGGYTTSYSNIPTLSSSTTTGNAEIQQTKQKMNQGAATSPLNNTMS